MTRLKARFSLGLSYGSEDTGHFRGAKWRVDWPMNRMLCKTLPPQDPSSPGFRFAGTDGCRTWLGAPPTTMVRCYLYLEGQPLPRRRRGIGAQYLGNIYQDPRRAETPLNASQTRLGRMDGSRTPRGFPFRK